VSIIIPASTTNQLATIAVDVSEIESLFLYTDGVLTLKTNSSGSPAQTLAFAASKPLVWNTGMPVTCPLTADITAFYLTNATASDITLAGFILQSL
jgi:sulfur relay (sulfurtransferase) complex TusBCD TusD component (DsrE family)